MSVTKTLPAYRSLHGELGRVATTANSHLLVDFPPLFVGISLLAFGQAASTPPQSA